MTVPTTESIVRQVEAAFWDAAYPGDDRLTDSTYGEEHAALVADFRSKDDWRTLPEDWLDQAPDGWGTALSFFSYEALAFYLPAYLRADLRGGLRHADPAARLCLNLTAQTEGRRIAKAWGGGALGERDREGFQCFTDPQVHAILAYLEWRLEGSQSLLGMPDPVIEQALRSYWRPRAAGP